VYVIEVKNPDAVTGEAVEVTVDGTPSPDGGIRLLDDGARHEVIVQRVGTGVREREEVAADEHI
jgi:hypothetical protein